MDQTRKSSLIEAIINTMIGFGITLAISPIIYPLFGHVFTFSQNVGITAIFTIVNILRGYTVRRWFNARIKRISARMAK